MYAESEASPRLRHFRILAKSDSRTPIAPHERTFSPARHVSANSIAVNVEPDRSADACPRLINSAKGWQDAVYLDEKSQQQQTL